MALAVPPPSSCITLRENRQEALERMAIMTNMGLHVFHPEWQTVPSGSMPRGRQYSTTFKTTTLRIFGGDEDISFPVQTCTRAGDVKDSLCGSLGVDPESVHFFIKQGCSLRKLRAADEMATLVLVKGIKTFRPQRHQWPHPAGVIGAGYNGLKTAMIYAKSGNNNFVVFDRNDKVGGYCWITAANKHSKLQTEFGSFHIWWGQDCTTEKCPYPKGWEIWPKKEKVLEHFHYAAESYGVLPNFQFKTNVAKMDIVGDKDSHDRFYKLSVHPVEGGDSREVNVSLIYNYPGCMTRNRIIDYPGEDIFEGHVAYGMNDDCPYEELKGQNVAILGNGAFAVENARTCSEHAADKVFPLTRRKNLASPRVPCWFVHQGPVPTPGKLVLDMFKPMYSLAGFGDPWEYWSVHANSERTKVSIVQNSRFGIGDVTFLMVMYGKLEYIQDTVKRLTKHTVHLEGGRKLEGVTVILKSLGLLGDWAVDRLHKMNQMVGMYCDGDWRRPLLIDAIGMNAANFTTFSTGIGSHGFVLGQKYLHALEESCRETRHLRTLLQRMEVMEEHQEAASAESVSFKNLMSKVEALGEETARLVQAQQVTENDMSRLAGQDWARHLEARMRTLEKSKEMQGADLERIEEQWKKRTQEYQVSMNSGMEKMRQSLLVLVRTELAKAFRSEAKAIASLTA